MDTSDCIYHCNPTRSPISQSNKRKATPREIKRPHVSNLTKPLATVPPPAIYVLLKNSPCSLNIQVELTSLTSLASISTSALLDSRATSMFINWSFVQNVMTGSPGDGIGPEAGRLRLSHWAGPSVTGSAKLSQSFYGGIIIA